MPLQSITRHTHEAGERREGIDPGTSRELKRGERAWKAGDASRRVPAKLALGAAWPVAPAAHKTINSTEPSILRAFHEQRREGEVYLVLACLHPKKKRGERNWMVGTLLHPNTAQP